MPGASATPAFSHLPDGHPRRQPLGAKGHATENIGARLSPRTVEHGSGPFRGQSEARLHVVGQQAECLVRCQRTQRPEVTPVQREHGIRTELRCQHDIDCVGEV